MKLILESHQFRSKDHAFLQELWLDAHYEEKTGKAGKELSDVAKYRVRMDNPFPRTIRNGGEKSCHFKVSSKIVSLKYILIFFCFYFEKYS